MSGRVTAETHDAQVYDPAQARKWHALSVLWLDMTAAQQAELVKTAQTMVYGHE